MNVPIDNLRIGLADLAEEVTTVDLLDRAVTTSRRLRMHRMLAGLAATVAVVGVASGVALAARHPEATPDLLDTPPVVSISATPTRPAPSSTLRPPTGGPTAPPSVPPSMPPPTSPAIPSSGMLQREDLGPGYRVSDDNRPDDHGSLHFLLAYCGYKSATWAAKDDHDVARRSRSLSVDDDRYVLQEATRYEAGWAARVTAELRKALRGPCRTVAIGGDPAHTSTLTLLPSGLAGSLLVREVRKAPGGVQTQYHIAFWQGDVYAHARIHIDGVTESRAREIGLVAASRMCKAIPSC